MNNNYKPKFQVGDRIVDNLLPGNKELSCVILAIENDRYRVLRDSGVGSTMPGWVASFGYTDTNYSLDRKFQLIKEFNKELEDLLNG